MIFLIIFLLLLLIIFIICLIDYIVIFSPPTKAQQDPDNLPDSPKYNFYKKHMLEMLHNLQKLSYEEIFIKSVDGTKLRAQYYHLKDGAPVTICFHGYKGVGTRDFCGGADLSMRLNHNVLLVDQRAHGGSGGHTITFGIKERWDCKAWCDYLVQRWGSDIKIILYGISMGAATVLMASGLDLPASVKLIVADCPYSSPKKIIKKCCRDLKLSDNFFYPFIKLSAFIIGHFNLEKTTAAAEVKKSKLPILIIHGDDDGFVPCQMSEEIALANPKVKRVVFPGADHAVCYMEDTPRYEKLVRDFLAENFE